MRFDEDESDFLQEIANIGMGQGGASLSELLGQRVLLSIPRLVITDAAHLTDELQGRIGERPVTATRQGFTGTLSGEALSVFGDINLQVLQELLAYDEVEEDDVEELLCEVANVLAGACLGSIAGQLGWHLRYKPPAMAGREARIHRVIDVSAASWSHVLILEITFSLQERDFSLDLFLFVPEDALKLLKAQLGELMEAFLAS